MLLPLLAALAALIPTQPNVLLICVDDLRPELGSRGSPAITPSLDALAAEGRRFDRHYAVVPTCGASRAALLTGLAPSTPEHLGNGAVAARQDEPTLPRAFRNAGYTTATLGKVMHWPADPPTSPDELPGAWSRTLHYDSEPWGNDADAFFAYADGTVRTRGQSPIAESPDVDDHAYPDARIADAAIDALQNLASDDRPFLLAVGFFKPHLPFNAPKRYRDLYDRETIPDAPHPHKPDDLPPINGWRQSGEVTGNYAHDMWDDRAWDAAERAFMRHAYLACVSYVDAQIGRVLDALDDQGLADDTIVVVWGDHGWHLGEYGLMGKHTTFEEALRSTLIIRAPNTAAPGEPTNALTSTLDLFPTLADLCNVPPPPDLPGRPLTTILLQNPNAPHRDEVTSWWRTANHIATTTRTDNQRTVTWRTDVEGPTLSTETYTFP